MFPLEIEDLMYQYEPRFFLKSKGHAVFPLEIEVMYQYDPIYEVGVHIIEELPKSLVGKVLRRVLRVEYGGKK